MVDEFLRRSNGPPLHILLNIPRVSRDWTAFQDIFQKIMGASDRWQSLRINTPTENVVAIAQNIECKAAPLLESLDIHLGWGEKFVRQPMLHLGPTPSLTSLIIHGIGLKIGDVSSFVDKLEVVQSQETPRLRRLDLRSHVPPLKSKQGAAFKKYAASLTSLSLGYVRDLGRIPSLMRSPLLQELSLHSLGYDAFDSFVERLENGSFVFPALHTLTLSDVAEGSVRNTWYLRTAFPALERLFLHNVEAILFIDLLSRSGSRELFWPSLHALTIYPVDYRDLCPLVDVRIEAGCPLATLQIISAGSVHGKSLSWLQKHVAVVKQLPKFFAHPVYY
ncbi:hypothetical protein DFH06DRAFT_1379666 [Mycena polygramma]|nr:hypothetical protein DFH06DRAFT_1379666 [Mycena polygramma]